jgi:predicted ABC-type transport system involved in lysophospholipase L1 biosynthesis ATPase subunit
VGEAGEGDVGQRAALEAGPDALDRVEVGGIGRELEHAQPRLGGGEGAQFRLEVHLQVVPDQDDHPAGQLTVRGGEQVAVLLPGERLALALAAAVLVQPP